jgi:hypothetical protein
MRRGPPQNVAIKKPPEVMLTLSGDAKELFIRSMPLREFSLRKEYFPQRHSNPSRPIIATLAGQIVIIIFEGTSIAKGESLVRGERAFSLPRPTEKKKPRTRGDGRGFGFR